MKRFTRYHARPSGCAACLRVGGHSSSRAESGARRDAVPPLVHRRPITNALSDELRKLGWIEGTTIVIERKEAGGRFDRLPALAADLVRSKPDLIVAFAPQPVRAVKEATSEIPIVMIFVADPVGMGLVSSLARPGGNLTGVATLAGGDFGGKTLGILRELLPQAKRVAAFINPSNEIHRLGLEGSTTCGCHARLSARRYRGARSRGNSWRNCHRQSRRGGSIVHRG